MTDERLLIDRARSGDMDAFRELVERSRMNVYSLAYDLTGSRSDAEDLSQEVFIRAFRSLPGFRGDAKWSTWIYRITMNICLDHKRMQKRAPILNTNRTDADPETLPATSMASASPEQSAESALLQQRIERALDSLTAQERTVFVLRHYQDLSLKQIAETMKIAEGTVKSHLFRAIQRLKGPLSMYRNNLGLKGGSS